VTIDYQKTFRALERSLESIERSAQDTHTLSGILEAIILGPGPALGLSGARLYKLDPIEGVFVLEAAVGEPYGLSPGLKVPADYLPIVRVQNEGLVLITADDPGFDPSIEGRVGVGCFAAISVGESTPHLIAFTINNPLDTERVIYLLGIIQLSLLPAQPPSLAGFDIAGKSVPAERVGGDLFDYHRLSDKVLGVSVVDSSGHGLPAALMARDVITGLRVVLDVEYRMTRAIEKVNRVVARSGLTSRFITLFYAEFESNGNLVYCNAGHPPPLLLHGGQIRELREGGIVLGPDPKATYERGFESFEPGSVVLLYTDGISEAVNRRGIQFGTQRLARLLRQLERESAQQIVDAVFEAVGKHTGGVRADDQTVVVIRRLGQPTVSLPPPEPAPRESR
jgi:hypothetical protein